MADYNSLNMGILPMADFNSLSEEKQIRLVQLNRFAIQHIDNPSEAVQLAAIQKDGYVIRYINNPSEVVQLAAVRKDGQAVLYIKNPSEKVIKYCLYECDISHIDILKKLYEKLTSDEDKIYFKLKYGSIFND